MGGDKGDVGVTLARNSIYSNFEVQTVLKLREEYKPKPKVLMDSTPSFKVPLIKRSIQNSTESSPVRKLNLKARKSVSSLESKYDDYPTLKPLY